MQHRQKRQVMLRVQESFLWRFDARIVFSVLNNIRNEFVDFTETTQRQILTLRVMTHQSLSRYDVFVPAVERVAIRASSACTCTIGRAKPQLNKRYSWASQGVPMSTDLFWRVTNGGPFVKT